MEKRYEPGKENFFFLFKNCIFSKFQRSACSMRDRSVAETNIDTVNDGIGGVLLMIKDGEFSL